MMKNYRVSADVGGTFTDFVVEDGEGSVRIGKVATTPDNLATGILAGLHEVAPDARSVNFFVHGTTVGLNAFLERRGARVLLVMTGGIADTYTIARGHRTKLYSLHYHKPKQLVPRCDVHEVRERLNWDGSVQTPLHAEDAAAIIEKVRKEGITAIAVCLLHAYTNSAHERQLGEILKKALPDVSVSLSHEVAPEWREFERASSTVMDAYIAPVVDLYLKTLKKELVEIGMTKTVHVMRSNGGIMTDKAAKHQPISTLLSGPVGGSIGGVKLSEQTGRDNLLCVDMGGTSFDVSLVTDGAAEVTSETLLEGLPLLMPIVDINTVGTGGGSLAWLENGSLRVGPQSAGSVPGPVCYGRGGTRPTVTDANLFLGRLGKDSLLSGRMSLDIDAMTASIGELAQEIGLSPTELAEGILSISNAKMADAMRTITVGQGIDPREYTLVAFGGAGPMHAVELARELDIDHILIPRFPGTFSAWGMLQSEIRHDFTVSFYKATTETNPDDIAKECEKLQVSGQQVLGEEDVAEANMEFQFSADLRYTGQEYVISASLKPNTAIDTIVETFHAMHAKRYGHSSPNSAVEFVNLRLAAIGRVEGAKTSADVSVDGSDPIIGTRAVVFDNLEISTPIMKRSHIPIKQVVKGPAIIEEESATTVVPPAYTFELDELGNIVITAEQSQ